MIVLMRKIRVMTKNRRGGRVFMNMHLLYDEQKHLCDSTSSSDVVSSALLCSCGGVVEVFNEKDPIKRLPP